MRFLNLLTIIMEINYVAQLTWLEHFFKFSKKFHIKKDLNGWH